MAWIGDTHYEILPGAGAGGRLVRSLPSGEHHILGVRGRPDFTSGGAMSGVLYRAEWLTPAAAAHAVRFSDAEELREGGNCLHLVCRRDGAQQWWCYRPREQDDGTLSLLGESPPPAMRARRRRLRLAAWSMPVLHRIDTARQQRGNEHTEVLP